MKNIVNALHKQAASLEKKLVNIRQAIVHLSDRPARTWKMSAEARARIGAAQKKRWAALRRKAA